jgi:hypothetical protein
MSNPTIVYHPPEKRGGEYSILFEVIYADKYVYPVGGSVAIDDKRAHDCKGIVCACLEDAMPHINTMTATRDALAKVKKSHAKPLDIGRDQMPEKMTMSLDGVKMTITLKPESKPDDVAEAPAEVEAEAAEAIASESEGE